jgi:predicted DNA-binding transcriptional regulator YafY
LITPDLVTEMLSYAENVTVISPKSLIKEVLERHKNAMKQYKKK